MWKIFASMLIVLAFNYSPPSFSANLSLTVCEYIAANDKRRLRSFLKSNKLKIRKIFKGIRCNGKNLLLFAAKSNAVETAEMIIGKLSKKIIKKNLEELTKLSAPLTTAANKRIE